MFILLQELPEYGPYIRYSISKNNPRNFVLLFGLSLDVIRPEFRCNSA